METQSKSAFGVVLEGHPPAQTSTVSPYGSNAVIARPFAILSDGPCTEDPLLCRLSIPLEPAFPGSYGTKVLSGHTASDAIYIGAMTGLDYYLPFTDNSGTIVSDASGNHRDGVISGSGNAAVWIGGVGLQPNDQTITIPNASGRPVRGLCAYFPATQSGHTQYEYLYSYAVGQMQGQAFDSFYGAGDEGHGSDADFPAVGFSNGATETSSLEGFSGIHCEEEIVGTSASDPDHIIVDGLEVPYFSQSFSSLQINAAGLAAPMLMASNTVGGGPGQNVPVFYSAWGTGAADTVRQAKSRTLFELARLTGLGVGVIPQASPATDSTCSITGTSIDLGYLASYPPSDLLALDFPCTVQNFAVGGQAPKDMAGAVQDREATVYHADTARNIAYNGGPTNGVMNYLETAANAYQDVVDWNNKVHALGYKSIVTTMISRCGFGSHGSTGDQLKQAFNALLLANADQFDWVANQAAAPQIGADSACANPTYFADAASGEGTHLTDAGQQFYVAAERAAFEGVYGTPSTSVSGTYTQLPSDRMIQANGPGSYTIFLMDANIANFNESGTLCVENAGSGNVTLTAAPGQTVNGNQSVRVYPGAKFCVRATVEDPSAAGAVWIAAP